MAAHSSTIAWKTPCMEEPGRLQSMGLQRVGYDWVTSLSFLSQVIFSDDGWMGAKKDRCKVWQFMTKFVWVWYQFLVSPVDESGGWEDGEELWGGVLWQLSLFWRLCL